MKVNISFVYWAFCGPKYAKGTSTRRNKTLRRKMWKTKDWAERCLLAETLCARIKYYGRKDRKEYNRNRKKDFHFRAPGEVTISGVKYYQEGEV